MAYLEDSGFQPVESHVAGLAKEDILNYCGLCGQVIHITPAGGMVFRSTSGPCTCNWGCCPDAFPRNQPHKHHHASIPVGKITPEIQKRLKFPGGPIRRLGRF